MRITAILVIIVISLSRYAVAENWVVMDIYGDASPLLVQPKNPINLAFIKETSEPNYKKEEKTISSDFDEFMKETFFTYATLWGGRVLYAPYNARSVFTTSLSHYLHNITGWQGCKRDKSEQGLCSLRKPFLHPPLLDGDAFKTNFIQHPVFGASAYLYYRAMGYDRPAASLASFTISTLFEYTVEGALQPPSLNDIVATPGLGVPLGMVLEETSNLLANSDSQILRFLSFIINPARLIVPDGEVAWNNLLARTISIQFNW
jgi:hypothetical protein